MLFAIATLLASDFTSLRSADIPVNFPITLLLFAFTSFDFFVNSYIYASISAYYSSFIVQFYILLFFLTEKNSNYDAKCYSIRTVPAAATVLALVSLR